MSKTLTERDLCRLEDLEKKSFSDPWSKTAFSDFLKNEYAHLLVRRESDTIVAYAAFTTLSDYGELLTFCVAETHRKNGIGRALLSEVLEFVSAHGVTDFTLEVRKSNTAARTLYESLGAREIGTRRAFYTSPTEDAILYTFSRKDTDR